MLLKRFAISLLFGTILSVAAPAQTPVGVFEHHHDVGAVATPAWSPDSKKIAFVSNTEIK